MECEMKLTKELQSILDTWKSLNDGIQDLEEEQVKALLEYERDNLKRIQFLLRIYGRYNTLRTIRERKELVSE